MENIHTFLLLSLLFLLPILLLLLCSTALHHRRLRLPPGPPGLPLLGNLLQLDSTILPHQYFRRLSRKYGPLLHLKLGFRHVLVANSSKMAEEILKSQDLNFCSRPPLLALRKLSYGGFDMAFAPYGEHWREMRKVSILHLLSSARVKSFAPIREDEVSRMIQDISRQASSSGAAEPEPEPVNLSDKIVFLASTIICRIAFGKRFERGSDESREFNRNILGFQTALSEFYFSDYFPGLGGCVDRLTGKTGRLLASFRTWDRFYQDLIDQHILPDRPESMIGDVLDILLQLREKRQDISLDHIKADLVDVFFASTDTISTTLVWAMTALVKNPDCMKAAQAEIRALPSLSGAKKKQMVEENDIFAGNETSGLSYFNATIKEILRLYAPIPLLLARESIRNCTISGYDIPAGTMVHVNAWAISRDPELWENPEEFKPERFMGEYNSLDLNMKSWQDFRFLPFGAGRRGCPGISMALATLEIVLANLIYAFDWELPEGVKKEDVDTDVGSGITLHKKNPLYLVPKTLFVS